MPALVWINRRWQIGSDDLVIPSFLLFIVRLSWIVLLGLVLVGSDFHFDNCDDSWLLKTYFYGAIILWIFSIIVEFMIGLISKRGTILNDKPREKIWIFLYLFLFLVISQVLWTSLGTYWAFYRDLEDCDNSVSSLQKIVKGIVISEWVMAGIIFLVLFILLDRFGNRALELGETRMQWKYGEDYIKTWTEKLRGAFSLCVSAAEVQELGTDVFFVIGSLFSDFFRDLDVVPSDLIAGVVLLRKKHKIQGIRKILEDSKTGQRTNISEQRTERSNTIDFSNPERNETKEIVESAYFISYALAAYGWPLYVFKNLSPYSFKNVVWCCCANGCCFNCNSCCLLPPNITSSSEEEENRFHLNPVACCGSCRCCGGENENEEESIHHGDNCWGYHLFTLYNTLPTKEEADLVRQFSNSNSTLNGMRISSVISSEQPRQETDSLISRKKKFNDGIEVIFSNFHNRLFQSPYFISVDHNVKAVVVCIRGTLSASDAITDAFAIETPWDITFNNITISSSSSPSPSPSPSPSSSPYPSPSSSSITIEHKAFVHEGMLRGARNILSDIESRGILRKTLIDDPITSNYRLVVTGHSLGAGLASILLPLLRSQYLRNDPYCYAFSVPSIMDYESAVLWKNFTTSIVLGKDVVPRLCYRSLLEFRDEILQAISLCPLPKVSVMSSKVCIDQTIYKSQNEYSFLFPEHDVEQPHLHSTLKEQGFNVLTNAKDKDKTPNEQDSSLESRDDIESLQDSTLVRQHFPPGKVLHLVKLNNRDSFKDLEDSTSRTCCLGNGLLCSLCKKKERKYVALWAENSDLTRIVVSPLMFGDHLPDKVSDVLKIVRDEILKTYHPNTSLQK